MARAVSQVSRSTRTRLTILRRLLALAAFLVIAAIVLAQFTSLGKLAAGIFASTAVIGLIVGFAAQNTISNVIAGVLIAITQPIWSGDRVSFEDREGRVTDITLSYTFIDPGDGSRVVIPNQLLVQGIVHNHSEVDAPTA
jgi:small-conductance mechanosensitive channel